MSQGIQFVQSNENQSYREAIPDGMSSIHSIAPVNQSAPRNESKLNFLNLMMNSVINEDISDENADEFFDYASRHNKLA